MEIRVTRARKIFSDGKHNAFTGIAAFRGRTFVTFRSAANHMSYDGTVRVIASDDLNIWSPVAEIAIGERDLRDPKIVAFKDSLLVFFGSRKDPREIRSMMCSSRDGVAFSEGKPLEGIPEAHWLWFARPLGDVLYGTAYCHGSVYEVALYRSANGLQWEKVAGFPVSGNEVPFDFDAQGRLWALVREDYHGCVPAVCVADPPYTSFKQVTRIPIRMQGPMVKRLDGGCVIVCRRWDLPGRRNLRTELFWLADGRDIELVRALPSGGDTSYANWLDIGRGAAVMSYYSSHEHKMDEPHANNARFAKDSAHAEHSTSADIFLADISYAQMPE